MFCETDLCRRRVQKNKITSKEMNAIPPKTPPTIAPTGTLFSAGVGTIEGLGDDVVPGFGTTDAVHVVEGPTATNFVSRVGFDCHMVN